MSLVKIIVYSKSRLLELLPRSHPNTIIIFFRENKESVSILWTKSTAILLFTFGQQVILDINETEYRITQKGL